jgi:hypothetical protein
MAWPALFLQKQGPLRDSFTIPKMLLKIMS